jgi:S-adenosylmethionine-diacylgycerolhomoserine-N-methlytransferase
VDHAARMDRIYAGQRHIYDLTRKYYLFGRDRMIDRLDLQPGATVLEVGCGTGRNLIRAARAWPDARFYGLDISAAMLTTARAKVAAAGLSGRITLAQADAADFDPVALFGLARFDRVVFSYTLSMIPPWRAALQQGLAVTAANGRLAVMDFGTQVGWPAWWRTAFLAWLRHFDVTPRADLTEEVTRLATQANRQADARPLWGGYACEATIA